MTDGKLAQQLVDNVIQIGARGQRIEIFLVFFLPIRRIHAVKIRIVEITALDPPYFVIHLFPFSHRIDVYFQVRQPQRAFTRLDRRRCRHDHELRRPSHARTAAPASAAPAASGHAEEHLLPIRR